MNRGERLRAMRMLEAKPHREIYEGAAAGGKVGSGKFYVSYSGDENSPELDREDIRILLEEENIKLKYEGVYVLK